MTGEEAVEVLKDLWCYAHSEKYSEKEIRKALEIAILVVGRKNSKTFGDLDKERKEKNDGSN